MPSRRKVGSVMTTEVTTVGPDTPFKAVALLLATWNISGAPVVDEDEKVLGVVSQGDLLEREAPHGLLKPGSRQAKRKAGAAFVADLMTAPAVVVRADDDVTVAAKLLEEHHFHRLPVVDDEGKLVGVVSRSDLLRVFLRTDREIRDEVREEVLLREMAMDPAALYVSVHNGIVTLNGTVERQSMIPVIVALIRRVDGVVEVRQTLQARFDDRDVSPTPSGPAGVLSRKRPAY
ncbi:CBS domain-containing protein [Amycolatopsis tolypomycina]|uniref:BON domain-containing protein n=1 Tax=Amycolatopsis tolypomycina TaxID=208445 RepID=A0A1H4UAW3_9PSEU|nr:CBS domain-containing protein [Amycolatopsis tolypomycina]SEC65760.1 BON domain-containing protein [Amycolatopsis tolypomycina]